jgi:hypothetical protein
LSRNERGVLAWAARLPRFEQLQLRITDRLEPRQSVLPQLTERELDEALRVLESASLVQGSRHEGDGTYAWWSNIRATAPGLVELGEWDLQNQKGLWLTRDFLVLKHFAENPLRNDYISTRFDEQGAESGIAGLTLGDLATSLELLSGAGYLDAHHLSGEGWGDITVTLKGRQMISSAEAAGRAEQNVELTTAARSVQRAREELWQVPVTLAFVPFSDDEKQILERFARQARLLESSSLVSADVQFTMKQSRDAWSFELDYAGDEAVQAATMSFRSLYRDDERASFEKAKAILRKSAVASSSQEREAIRGALDSLAREYRTLLKGGGPLPLPSGLFTGDAVEKTLKARQVIELWLYGEHFHWDPDKAIELAGFDPPELLLFTYVSVIQHSSSVYVALAELAESVLEQASLSADPPDTAS